jgi:Ni,Fe-hydrogenase I cytochrome b subunit
MVISGLLSKIINYSLKEEFANSSFFKVYMAFIRVILIYKGLFLSFLGVYLIDLNFIDKKYYIRELFFNLVNSFNELLGLLVNKII